MKICSVCHRFHEDSAPLCPEASRSTLSENLEIGVDPVPGYRLETLIEDSENLSVYRARQSASGHLCRAKIISASKADHDRFGKDAAIAAALFHPNIVDVYEAGSLDSGELFVVTEEPEGQTLRELIDRIGVPELMTSIEIVRQAAEAIHAIHQTGLVHRAVDPKNIILTRDLGGQPLVRIQNIDLGGVIETSIIRDKFSIDGHIESLRYFAPEQCSGEGSSVRSDVYSLGIILHELLAGAPPFDATNATALIHKHRNQAPPEIRIENFDLRMLVTHALSESLQKRASARQSSINLFARQLRHIEQLATHSSTPPPAGTVTASPARFQTQQHQPGLSDNLPTFRATTAPPATINTSTNDPKPIPVTPVVAERRREKTIKEPEAPVAFNTPAAVSEDVVAHEKVEVISESVQPETHEPRRSRLRTLKKKLHALSEEVKRRATTESLSLLQSPAEKIEPEPVSKTSRKIQWEQPDDDIPSMADVQEALAKEGLPEIVASMLVEPKAPEREEIVAPESKPVPLPVQKKPPVIEPVSDPVVEPPPKKVEPQVKKSVPVVQRPAPRPSSIPMPKSAMTDPERFFVDVRPVVRGVTARKKTHTKNSAVVTTATVPVKAKADVIDAEEITVVRARTKPIRIDLDQPIARAPKRRPDPSFVPTMLGVTAEVPADEVPASGGMFSNYVPTKVGYSGRGRSLLLGVGIVGLLSLLLLGSDSISRFFQSPSSAETVASTQTESASSPTAVQPIQRIEPPKAATEKSATSDSKLTAEKSVASGSTKSADRNIASNAAKESKPDAERRSSSARTAKDAEPIKPPKTTAVGKEKPAKADGAPSAATTAAGQTRPRIVKSGNR